MTKKYKIIIFMFLLLSAFQTFNLINKSIFLQMNSLDKVWQHSEVFAHAQPFMREVSMEGHVLELRPWDLIKAVVSAVGPSFFQNDLVDYNIEELLAEHGVEPRDIEATVDWIEKVVMSGSITDVVGMLQEQNEHPRVANPLEVAYLSQTLWKRIETCRLKGFLTNDLYEKLLEDIRVLDTRDWEDDEVKVFLVELMNSVVPQTAQKDFLRIMNGNSPEFYC